MGCFRRGSITLFLALILTAVFALLSALLESARMSGTRAMCEIAGHAAAESLMAAYNRPLFDEYGLLFFDADIQGEGSAVIPYDEIEELFTDYAETAMNQGNLFRRGGFFQTELDASLIDVETAADYGGEPFVRSALAFYKYDAAGNLLREIETQLGITSKGEAERENMLQGAKQTQGFRFVSAVDIPNYDAQILNTDVNGWLMLVMPRGKKVSKESTSRVEFPSLTAVDSRKKPDSTIFQDALEKAVFNEYLRAYFPSFQTQGDQKTPGLQYELEYILNGAESDEKNLKRTLTQLMFLREGMNLLSMEENQEVQLTLDAAAALMAPEGGEYELSTRASLAASWAYAESLSDMKALLSGKSVPLLKTEKQWKTSLGALEQEMLEEKDTAEEGLNYNDYLRLLLFLGNTSTQAYRAMDMIQENLRERYPGFYMQNQISAMRFLMNVHRYHWLLYYEGKYQ